MTAKSSKPELSHYRCFFNEIVDFIVGDSGKKYIIPPPRKTRNWDRVIEDLTSVTAKRVSAFIRNASSGVSAARGQISRLCFLSGRFPKFAWLIDDGTLVSMQEGMNGPPDLPEEPIIMDENEGGISIIEFIIESRGRVNE